MSKFNVPALVQHCTLAIMRDGYGFKDAFEIAKASLRKAGYLLMFSDGSTSITGKGADRERKHLRERTHRQKEITFSEHFNAVFRSEAEVESPPRIDQPAPAGENHIISQERRKGAVKNLLPNSPRRRLESKQKPKS